MSLGENSNPSPEELGPKIVAFTREFTTDLLQNMGLTVSAASGPAQIVYSTIDIDPDDDDGIQLYENTAFEIYPNDNGEGPESVIRILGDAWQAGPDERLGVVDALRRLQPDKGFRTRVDTSTESIEHLNLDLDSEPYSSDPEKDALLSARLNYIKENGAAIRVLFSPPSELHPDHKEN